MFKWKLVVVAVLGIGMAAFSKDKEEKKEKKDVVVELSKGSRIAGKADGTKQFILKTSFGEVAIPIEQVASVQFKGDLAVVRFCNGDQLTGTLKTMDMRIETVLGEMTVPFKLVTRCNINGPLSKPKVTARASSSGEGTNPMDPFEENNASWNSCKHATGWIEADLGTVRNLGQIVLITNQTPKGETVHEIWVSDEPIGDNTAKAKLAHTFKGETDHMQELKCTLSQSARYVQIRTTESPSWVAWEKIDLLVR